PSIRTKLSGCDHHSDDDHGNGCDGRLYGDVHGDEPGADADGYDPWEEDGNRRFGRCFRAAGRRRLAHPVAGSPRRAAGRCHTRTRVGDHGRQDVGHGCGGPRHGRNHRRRSGPGRPPQPLCPVWWRLASAACRRSPAGGCGPMTLEGVLVIAAALFAVGLYGALSQQVVVMVMMGLELMINGVLLAAAGFWWF